MFAHRKIVLLVILFVLFLVLTIQYTRASKDVLVLDLKKSIKIVLENNNDMKRAESKIRENTFKTKEIQSEWLPQLDFSASYIRTEPETEFEMLGQNIKVGQVNNHKLQLTLSQLIYSFGRLENSITCAKLKTETSKLDRDRVTQELILKTKESYFNILRAKKFLGVAQDSVSSNKKHLKTACDFYTQGIVPKYDVLRMETKLSESQEGLIRAQNNLKLAENILKNILNLDLSMPIEVLPESNSLKELDIAKFEPELIKLGLANRPESKQTKLSLGYAKHLIKLAAANDNPNLSLLYNYDWQNETAIQLKELWNATAVLSIPLFDSGITHNKVKQAQEILKQTEATADEIKNTITLEIKQAVLNFKDAKARLETTKKSVAQAKEALSIAEIRYQADLAITTELFDAQLDRDRAGYSYWNAFYDYKVAIANLERTTSCKLSQIMAQQPSH